jgi:hypothetical protein
MVEKLTACNYQWQIGELAGRRAPVTYLIGYPKNLKTVDLSAHTAK